MQLKLYRIYIITLLSLISFQISYAQNAYAIDWQKELYYVGTGIVANGVGYLLFLDTPEITYNDYLALDASKINRLDRRAIDNNSSSSDRLSDYLSNGSIGLPLAVYLLKIKDPAWRKSSIMFFELVSLNFAAVNISKYGFRRVRPYVYRSDLQPGQTISASGRASYMSGHTAFASSNSFFGAAIFHKAYPESVLVPYVYGLAAAVPAFTGIERVRAGKHFPTDIITGYLVGAGIAALVIKVHERDDLQIQSTGYGAALIWTF